MTGDPLPLVAHVPMALSTQASTLMTVAERIIDSYRTMGGESVAVLSDNRGVALPEADTAYVDYTRHCPREWFTRGELAVDVAWGAIGGTRPYYGRLYDPAVEALEAAPVDVVLLYEGHYASATLPRWRRVRDDSELCLYVHNPLSRTYGRRELTRLLTTCDRVIFCAAHLRDGTERRLGHSDERFEVVPNGVDSHFFAPADRERPERFTVVFAGRISETKGVHVLLEAVDLAAKIVDDRISVRIVGSSTYGGGAASGYELDLRRRAATMDADISFVGWCDSTRLAHELAQASVVCLPSLWAEGLPLVALEALASGSPIACSDSAGLMEAVGEVGLVSPMGDAASLARSLVRLASDEAEWRHRSHAGVERARAFSWEKTASRLAGIGPTHGSDQ